MILTSHLTRTFRRPVIALAFALAAIQPLAAQAQGSAAQIDDLTYADLADLAEEAELVVVAGIEDQIRVRAERAPGLPPGQARLYLEGSTMALLAGSQGLGESLAFLADLPLDEDGDAPDIEERAYILFAYPVEGRAGQLGLTGPSSMIVHSPVAEQRVRAVLTELASPDAPPVPTGLRDVISVPGNLAGESETQIFLETRSGAPLALNVLRRPNTDPEWGVSYTDIVDQAATAPAPDTLAWYRLACFLPGEIPEDAFLQEDRDERARAREDYAFILDALGPCARNR